MNNWCKNRTCLQYLSLALLLGLVFLTYTNRVDDLDLWWHLKSGETVWHDRALPQHDPFSYTTGATAPFSAADQQALTHYQQPSAFQYWGVSLRHSWLGQVLFYLAYAAGGFYGVGLLKALAFMLTFFVLFQAMREKQAAPLASLLVTFLVLVIGQDFAYSRPQIFTFLLLAGLFYLFAEFKRDGRKVMFLPALFLLWSNLHGGFVFGASLLLIFWLAEAGKYLLAEKFAHFRHTAPTRASLHRLSVSASLSFGAMLLNPNHYKAFLLPFGVRGSLFASIEEYARPMLYEYHAYWFMLALVLVLTVLLLRTIDPADLLLVAFLAAGSQMGIRGIILFTIGAAPFLARLLTSLGQWLGRRRQLAAFCQRPGVVRLATGQPQYLLFLVFLVLFGISQARAGVLRFSLNGGDYPEKGVAFLQGQDYPGRLFNPYNWGGYLIWQYPQRQVFIDGRCLDEQAFFQHQLIMGGQGGSVTTASPGQVPLWKRLLDWYDVQVVMVNAVSPEGVVVPLVDLLAFDPDWALVYQDGTALVFLRDNPANHGRYRDGYLDKRPRIFDEIVSESETGVRERPATKGYYELLGTVYLNRRELGKSREMFEKYLNIDPNNAKVIQNLNLLRQMGGEAPLPLPQQPKSPHSW